MENQENTSNNDDQESQDKNKVSKSVVGILALVIVILGIFVLVFKPKDEANAPVIEDNNPVDIATSTATSTDSENNGSTTTPDSSDNYDSTMGTQVGDIIQGDGFTGVITGITKVEKENPLIKNFGIRSKSDSTCTFNWEVEKSVSCNFVYVGQGKQVSDVGAIGNLQIGEGMYQLECEGKGEGEAKSEIISCEIN